MTLDQVAPRPARTTTYPVALATEARWEEAESLTRSAVHGGKVHYLRTKNRQSRSVPIPGELERLMLKVGMPGSGRLFMSCRAAFRCAYQRCGFQTPGQMTHILRHTFASHYMIMMTMRYAHLSPEHLESAMRFSPITQSGYKLTT
ncbi:integrase [Pseudomonas aeruginosa]|nr:integrase [Pseudomonas aeruginosa]